AKICQMRFAFCIEQNVSRFNISMQNAVRMRVMNCSAYLCDQFRRMPDRHRRAADHFVKLASLDELHAEIAGAISLTHLVDRDDAWMIEARGGFRFPAKALQVCFGRPLTKTDDF